MIRIAIVEDEPALREQLAAYIERYRRQYGGEFSVQSFADGDEIVSDSRAAYDIIFLDIQMKRMDGMAAAERIRAMDREVLLIFITNMAQFAIKGYAVDAMDYVLKPVPYFAFSQELQKAVARLQKRARRYLAVPTDNGLRRLDTAEIEYLESDGHRVRIVLAGEEFYVAGTLREYEEKLADHGFARCNSWYLVNLARVLGVEQNDVQVGAHRLPISRPRKKGFMEALTDYIGGVAR